MTAERPAAGARHNLWAALLLLPLCASALRAETPSLPAVPETASLPALDSAAQTPLVTASQAVPNPAAQSIPNAATPAAENPVEPGSITGVVMGSEDAVYEGATVTLEPLHRKTTTDGMGSFRIADVPPGRYTLVVAAPGFKTARQALTLDAGQPLALPAIRMEIAPTTTQVLVTPDEREIATQEVHAEEQQRVFGFIPNFYVVYDKNAPPLTKREKFHLAWRTMIDPFTFVGSAAVAGVQQATDAFSGYGQGAEGYADRFGADLGDNEIGTFLGGAVFPSLFHQDPRYLVLGPSSTTRHRIWYALENAVICRGDNRKFQFCYSGLLGSLAAAGISNFYYPAVNRHGASLTFENLGIGIAASGASNIFQEFFVRRWTPHAQVQTDTP